MIKISGYLKIHGLKVLTVVFPNGIIAYLYGPVSARENDIGLLNLSWLNEHLVALQPEITAARANGDNLLYFSLYGDKIFPYLQCITHAHEPPLGGQLQPRQRLEVLAMNSLRTSVEWPYGDVTVLFSIMRRSINSFASYSFCIIVTSVSTVTSLRSSLICLLLA